ncbi:MAG: DUF1611 domain-containing protein [Gemmatimonadota bacterium]|nr:MAG: DUF1611 domain-containing protein [Gemmatimonadota bacterium]
MNEGRRIVILAEGAFGSFSSKTGVGALRYIPDEVVAVIDSTKSGNVVDDIIGYGNGCPIVASLEEALQYRPNTLLIGVAPRGGVLPEEWRDIIREAIEHRMTIVNGLHFFLSDDEAFASLARRKGVVIEDLRKPPRELPIASGAARHIDSHVVLTVGSDCDTGKMTVTFELFKEARLRELAADCIPTGQTGMLVWGKGVAIDRVAGDFMAGTVEKMVLESSIRADWIFVEGQGSLFHPGYSGVTLALLHGCAPQALVLCHQPSRKYIGEYLGDTSFPIPPLPQVIRLYEEAAHWIRTTKVVAIALNCYDLTEKEIAETIDRIEDETKIPTTDCIKFGAAKLMDALEDSLCD